MDTRVSGHTAYRTEYHLVWIPKYRRRILNPGVASYLLKILPKILRGMPGCEVVRTNIQIDHLHMLMIIPPKYAVSAVVGQLKQATARHLRETFPYLHNIFWKEPIVWSPGFFVSTVGIDEEQIIKYIQWQAHQDSGQAQLAIF